MTRSISRTAARVLSVTLALGAAALPCAAADTARAKSPSTLTHLSSETRRILATPSASRLSAQAKDPGAGGPTSASTFFHSTRGKVTVVLMAAGAGLAIWSASHDRKPVKSPIR